MRRDGVQKFKMTSTNPYFRNLDMSWSLGIRLSGSEANSDLPVRFDDVLVLQ